MNRDKPRGDGSKSFAKLARELAAERPKVSAGKPGEETLATAAGIHVVKAAPKRTRPKSTHPYAVARRQAADFRAANPKLVRKGDPRSTAAHYRPVSVSVTR